MLLTQINQPIPLIEADKELIIQVQTQLKKVGLLNLVDGIAGAKTISAFRKFKELEYLEQPDILGKTTAKALLETTSERTAPTEETSPITGGMIPPANSRSRWRGEDSPRHSRLNVTSQEKLIKLPGGNLVKTDQHISKHFTWGEATKQGSRIPENKEIVGRIIKTAYILDEVRAFLSDRSITITSWYRPLKVNKAVGGASSSRHLLGDGVDFQVEGMPGLEVYNRLDGWYGHRGGLGKARSFTHLDNRQYAARWLYSNK